MDNTFLLPSPSLDYITPTLALAVRSPSGTGFNFTQQDIDVHTAERISIKATFAISSIFPALAIIAVILRFVAASKSKAGRTADDWVILAALIPTVASCVWMICTYTIDASRIMKSFFAEAEKGNFTELDDPLGNANALQWGPGVVSTFYLTALALIKISILLLYNRLFPTKMMNRFVIAGIAFIIALWITFAVPSLLGLANLKGLSNGTIFIFILVFACINVVTDLGLLILPVPFVWKLKLTTARKLQIVGMFSLGAFCVISSSVRLAFLAEYWRMLQFIFAHELNWYATFTLAGFAKRWWMTWIWALIEPCTSIIAACLPTLRPLVDGLHERDTWISRVSSAMYPKTLFSRTSRKSKDGTPDSTELGKVEISVKQEVEVSETRLNSRNGATSASSRCESRPDWNTSQMNSSRGQGQRSMALDPAKHVRERELV